MRVQLAVVTAASELPWGSVLAPGRGLVYDVLGRVAPELGRRLHENGEGPRGMAPFGHSAPVFASAPRRRGRYTAGGRGVVEFGSPLPEVVSALAAGFAERELLDWGGVALRLTGAVPLSPPAFASGRAVMRTATPVVMKGSGRDEEGVRTTRQAWLLPTEPEWPGYFQGSLRRKAETLGLDADLNLEAITWIGPKRSFAVGQGAKPGAAVEVELTGAPETLQALWSWGLGQANSAGFGWVNA
ncbi:CRISPR-associated endoribonuclease Cas6 [Streptomyces sp. SP17BM10]|uniref:CRISPR-associated endoribonuclease Cas6 n=1 Tax=Streptomyces sp. SP17BM10 TaxID=3002530 RepID=UPI002E76B9C6|nr:CRISPR-associated endoribonuclease Cas6 [Streptomyces sp. SP17BM10]MEE1783257.1 CRISPR-associated endoribonuclease Cas6 [Streptomyces sp. SP17BM10]